MRFTILAAEWNAKLVALAKVMNSKVALPIYSTFLLELKDGVLRITASDMDCSRCSTLPVMDMDRANEHNGSLCVTASFLLDSLKNLGDQPVTFEADEENLSVVIRYNNGQFDMVGFPAKDYALPGTMGKSVQVTIEASVLNDSIGKSLYAVGNDDLRPIFSGIYFTKKGDELQCATTNGSMLVRNTYKVENDGQEYSFLLHSRAAKIVRSMTSKSDEKVQVFITEREVACQTETDYFRTRLIEGKYPNYNAVIPTDSDKTAILDKNELLAAVRRVSVFADKARCEVVMNFSGLSLVLSGKDIDYSTHAEEMVFCAYQGGNLRISFKAEFLKQTLENITTKEVQFKLSTQERAGVITLVTDDDQMATVALIMPILLSA
jgi:DNA polymerase-3 subunit beta